MFFSAKRNPKSVFDSFRLCEYGGEPYQAARHSRAELRGCIRKTDTRMTISRRVVVLEGSGEDSSVESDVLHRMIASKVQLPFIQDPHQVTIIFEIKEVKIRFLYKMNGSINVIFDSGSYILMKPVFVLSPKAYGSNETFLEFPALKLSVLSSN